VALKAEGACADAEQVTPDSGSIVLGWLTKLALTIGLVGLLAFDGVGLVTARFNAADHANAAASVAADNFHSTHNVQAAYDAAVASVAGDHETIEAKTFHANAADGKVTLTLHRKARTLWMQRIGVLKKYLDISESGEGSPPS